MHRDDDDDDGGGDLRLLGFVGFRDAAAAAEPEERRLVVSECLLLPLLPPS